MRDDEIQFVYDDLDMQGIPGEPKIYFVKIKSMLKDGMKVFADLVIKYKKYVISAAISIAVILSVFFAILFIKSREYKPVHYFTDYSSGVAKIHSANKRKIIFKGNYSIYSFCNNKDATEFYIVVTNSDLSNHELYYINNNSSPELVLEGDVGKVFFVQNDAYMLKTNTDEAGIFIGYDLYKLDGVEVKEIAKGVLKIAHRLDGLGIAFKSIDNQLFRYQNEEIVKLSDNAIYFWPAPYSDEIYFCERDVNSNTFNLFVSREEDSKELIIDDLVNELRILDNGCEVFFQASNKLYFYSPVGIKLITDNFDFIINIDCNNDNIPVSKEILYCVDNSIYYLENPDSEPIIIPHEIEAITSTNFHISNNRSVYYYTSTYLYEINPDTLKSHLISRTVTDVVSERIEFNNRTSSKLLGFIKNNSYHSICKNGDIHDENVIFIFKERFKDGLIIVASPKNNSETYNLYYMENGECIRIIDENIYVDYKYPDYITDYIKVYGDRYFTYLKYKSKEPVEMDLYATNCEESMLLAKNFFRNYDGMHYNIGNTIW